MTTVLTQQPDRSSGARGTRTEKCEGDTDVLSELGPRFSSFPKGCDVTRFSNKHAFPASRLDEIQRFARRRGVIPRACMLHQVRFALTHYGFVFPGPLFIHAGMQCELHVLLLKTVQRHSPSTAPQPQRPSHNVSLPKPATPPYRAWHSSPQSTSGIPRSARCLFNPDYPGTNARSPSGPQQTCAPETNRAPLLSWNNLLRTSCRDPADPLHRLSAI